MSAIKDVLQSLFFDDLDIISTTLQFMQYVASIAAVGSILLMLTLRTAKTSQQTESHFWRQAQIGAFLLLLLVPLQILHLLTNLFDSDWSLIFSTEAIELLAEISTGHSAALCFASAAMLLICCWRQWLGLGCVSAAAILGSFLLTGHTVSFEHAQPSSLPEYSLTALLFVHLLLLHWWIAVIWPLRQMAKQQDPFTVQISHNFGRQAMFAVPLLLVAGGLLLVNLVNWQLDLSQSYQAWFLLKLVFVTLILMIAALNKLRYATNLSNQTEFKAFSNSLAFELFVSVLILAATSIAINVGLQ
ncbi:MAG: CopD family protein [Alphaproteobacteria bacterium]